MLFKAEIIKETKKKEKKTELIEEESAVKRRGQGS